ncbi:hypothetical protein WR25_25519 [Diploscapter pachys]|uniref:FH2 domain-containing protein n=1 Tax=Diploscapter pachys TaxID=2018661 RepID=A0A2A2JFT1_9BILA|nr:hypothetical protein WR25_25519 [Diploscapter pachys]
MSNNFSSPTERETDRVRTAILGLFNALLRTGPAETCVVFRSHLRFELLMLGVAVANEHIREGNVSPQLEDHLDLFDMMRKEDEITLQGLTPADSGSSSPIHFETAVGMAEALNTRLQSSMAMPHFVSLLQHLFIVPCDERHVPLWRLFDLIVQHLTLQTTVNGMTDVHRPIVNEIDMNEILARLQTHLEYEEVKKSLDAAEEELEKERTRVVELENRLADALDGRGSDSGRSSISSDRSSSPAISTVSASILPPVCPPIAPAPPPPPAIATLGRKPENKEAVRKVPQPKGPLKTLNWTKIPMDKVKGTVWDGIEDEKLYKQLDLSEIEQVFAASSSHSDEAESVLGTISRRNKETSVTVIDPRRFQNCTIMLSKLKMSHREIYHALISMDEKGKIPKDMIEQMLKFLPTTEEIALINDAVMKNGGSPACFALADRYLFEVAHIPRFEQRLRCLHLIRTFRDRVDALVPHIQAVTKASSAVSSNKRLRQYLALVLAIGNYLNYGKRNGNAYGFDVQSLNRLVDVKQSQKSDRNLLHYVIQLIEKKWPDLTKLKRDLASVFDAARFNRAEVLTEMRSLEQAIQIVRNELEKKEIPQEASLTDEGRKEKEKDRLSTVAKHFVSTATVDYGNLEKLMAEMNTKYCECARQLCVDATSPPEELFVPLSKFLTSFSEYHQQLWMENEAEEQVKRQTIARTYFAKKNRRRDKERDFEQLISALQSGDIFKEELCRLRTSFRVPKKA